MEGQSSIPEEEPLTGGNTAMSVVRIGSGVRKPVTPSTPFVQRFVAHLRVQGFRGAPEPLGVDDKGRQVWEYVPGVLWHDSKVHTSSDLRRVGAMIRELHDAAASFQAPGGALWEERYGTSKHDLICHNDLAPWNLVCGDTRWVFIDWDAAAPATRIWDLAWSCIAFPRFEPEADFEMAAQAMRLLLDGYGFEPSAFGELIQAMVLRARAEHDLIVEGAKRSEQPWLTLYAEGHHNYWGPVAAAIDRYASELRAMLLAGRPVCET